MSQGVGGLPQPDPHQRLGAHAEKTQGNIGDTPPSQTPEQAVYQLEIAIFNQPVSDPSQPQSIPEWIALCHAIQNAITVLQGTSNPVLQKILNYIDPLQTAAKNVLADADTTGPNPDPNFNKINTDIMPIRAAYDSGVFHSIAQNISDYWNGGNHQPMSQDVIDALGPEFVKIENDIQALMNHLGKIQDFNKLPQDVITAIQNLASDVVTLCTSLTQYAKSGSLDGFTLQFYDLMTTRYQFPEGSGYEKGYDSIYSFCEGITGSTKGGTQQTTLIDGFAMSLLKTNQQSVINLTQLSDYLELIKANDADLFQTKGKKHGRSNSGG